MNWYHNKDLKRIACLNVHLLNCGNGIRLLREFLYSSITCIFLSKSWIRVNLIVLMVMMVKMSTFPLVYSGKWPQAVRANGHLLLNSEKVCQIFMLGNIHLYKLIWLSNIYILVSQEERSGFIWCVILSGLLKHEIIMFP